LKAILSADINWGIGYKGSLLARVPEDMKFFREMTSGKVVVMGRETLESFPKGEPLKNRVNIVLSTTLKRNGLIICRSLKELFIKLYDFDEADIFIIGGESVYRQLLPYCSEALVTKFCKSFKVDRHFPNLDNNPDWFLDCESEKKSFENFIFHFAKYKNNAFISYRL